MTIKKIIQTPLEQYLRTRESWTISSLQKSHNTHYREAKHWIETGIRECVLSPKRDQYGRYVVINKTAVGIKKPCEHGRQIGKCDTCDLRESEQEINALKAQVNLLRSVLEKDHTNVFEFRSEANNALNKTPAQCLDDLRAIHYKEAAAMIYNIVDGVVCHDIIENAIEGMK